MHPNTRSKWAVVVLLVVGLFSTIMATGASAGVQWGEQIDYFDGTAGTAPSLELDADTVLFATDKVTEAVAASEAGLDVVILDRPGNPDQGAHDFPVAENFMRIF